MLGQMSDDWNPHMKLEFVKVAIRSTIASLVGKNRKELRNEIDEHEKTLNELHTLKAAACELGHY